MKAFSFSQGPLTPDSYRATLADPAAGGYSAFEGWVRNHNEGHAVTRLEYEAFEALGEQGRRAHRRGSRRTLRRVASGLRASRRLARDRRSGGVGRRQLTPSRRSVRSVPLHHRRSEAPRADLEERALRQRRFRLGQLRALRSSSRALTASISSPVASANALSFPSPMSRVLAAVQEPSEPERAHVGDGA